MVDPAMTGRCAVGRDKHSGDDDTQTDHLGKGSDGHTIESGDEK